MSLKHILDKEPVTIGAALTAILNLLVLLEAVDMSAAAVAGANVAAVALVGLFVRSKTSSPETVAKLEAELAAEKARNTLGH